MCIHFLSSSFYIALSKALANIMIRNRDNGNSSFALILKEMFSIFSAQCKLTLAIGTCKIESLEQHRDTTLTGLAAVVTFIKPIKD